MTPSDIRDMTWEDLQPYLEGRRTAVLEAWRKHGPGTTRQLARLSGIDLLTLRPRTTELVQVGLLQLAGQDGHEGIYRAVPADQARTAFEHLRATLANPQLHLALTKH
jgi:predicted transcriptional regulator